MAATLRICIHIKGEEASRGGRGLAFPLPLFGISNQRGPSFFPSSLPPLSLSPSPSRSFLHPLCVAQDALGKGSLRRPSGRRSLAASAAAPDGEDPQVSLPLFILPMCSIDTWCNHELNVWLRVKRRKFLSQFHGNH